jgi:oxygen-independent coproporphyrinogen-3 oxidase
MRPRGFVREDARVFDPTVLFDAALIRRYGGPGPRYTSYPTALQFSGGFSEWSYLAAAAASRFANPNAPLSVYVHIPFCTSPCFYCGCNRIITRQRGNAGEYLRRLEREIELQAAVLGGSRVIEQLHLGGGTPTFFNIDQLGCLVGSLERRFILADAAQREFSIEIDPRSIEPDVLVELAAFGFNRVSLGVQDFDPRVQHAINRTQSIKKTLDLIDEARTVGMRSVSVDLIYGLPLQTLASWEHTLDIVAASRPDRIAAYGYAHMPAKFKAQAQIDAADLPGPDERIQLLALTIARLQAAGYVYIGMDHFALPEDELAVAARAGRLQRNFQGYSTRAGLDLLGLGVSAIGQIGDTFSQNARQLDRYYAAIDGNHLALESGLTLSADDLVRRDVILSIMCRGKVRFHEIEARHRVVFKAYFSAELQRLHELEADGLVTRDDSGIAVTSTGRLLLRAVAMVFDAYLPQPESRQALSAVG